MKILLACVVLLTSSLCVVAQPASGALEKAVALSQPAVAFSGSGAPALEATLKTTTLNGAVDSPVTNIRMVVRNASGVSYAYVSGLVTFYDGAGVRCGEGLFKADALAVDEAFETDTPGIRIRCAPASWRILATNLLPRVSPNGITNGGAASPGIASSRSSLNLIISVDGEEHPLQLDKPMVVTLGDSKRTILVREAP
ncbi:MAG: hypothetical protein H7Z16_09340 [Pyrinomonadaceae bacterium]|nr:hypothetical protein [Pyrinomonadaceae bacterium]